jgi:hypothetical protein
MINNYIFSVCYCKLSTAAAGLISASDGERLYFSDVKATAMGDSFLYLAFLWKRI